jgi:hypothetical protein
MPTIQVGSIPLYYDVRSQGKPILFIHGLGSAAVEHPQQFNKIVATFLLENAD